MSQEKRNIRKKTGLLLLGIVVLGWIAVPILPFFHFPYKVAVITTVAVINEGIFIITIALLGKEYWGKIKAATKRFFTRKKDIKSPAE
ncbi:transporter suffix domain-containing protein [Chitinophaga varians]|uniref:transporter suffix domain-containing protein n=1 Tax=Chitinophaga varians TaxID=2202339 RepID=UPI00165F9A75|nr:transporter suffix domain-containing protein [Chitinophaga varians]MBC9914422.1 transporter suffix domain-containing protein [Chitinophaga varians]